MLKQLGLVELLSAVQKKVENNTELRCYDEVPVGAESPLYYVEVIGKRPAHSKTMWKDVFTVWVHAIAEPSKSSIGVYDLIQKLEEALTEDIELQLPHQLVMQTNNGLQVIKTDETEEKHAVLEYEFTVCYGFKMKN